MTVSSVLRIWALFMTVMSSLSFSAPAVKKVCVTGANGYVASELVKQLLAKGYHVRGTVRSLSNKERYDFLQAMATKSGSTLELFEADLQAPSSFDEAVDGCDYVFHVASPVVYNSSDPERDLLQPAVSGVKNVMASVAKAKGRPASPFKRLILTSSTGAIYGMGAKPKSGVLFTEEDWNEVSSPTVLPYYYSKVLAERTAWELAAAAGVDMVAVHPAYVWGPPTARQAATFNLQRLTGVLRGEQPFWPFDFPVCDTRDIAAVQIRAAELPQAKGRYIISSRSTVTPRWIAQVIRKRFPSYPVKEGAVDESISSKDLFDNSRVERELGLHFMDPQTTLVDTIQAAIDLGL